ncbi:MAG TPA: hypothetical protein VI588_02255, partial [Candidatus Gracilibacteria bacterium]|nr:hypothetical protein [Candidatus Gracilibacteria bacterium]
VESMIGSEIDSTFEEDLPEMRDFGLTDSTNMDIAKRAIKDVVFEHYLKTGNELQDVTAPYAKNVLKVKIKEAFRELKKIADKKEYGYASPLALLEDFSAFTELGFLKSGFLQKDSLKKMLRLERSTLTDLVTRFRSTQDRKLEIAKLDGDAANLVGKKMDVPTMFAEGRIQLQKKVRTVSGESGTLNEATLSQDIGTALPPNIDPKMKEAAIAWFIGEAKKMSPGTGEVLELSENGTWAKADIAGEQQVQEEAKKKAEESVTPSAEEDEPINTGNKTLDRFLNAIRKLFSSIIASLGPMLAKFGIKKTPESAEEFATLNEEEKKSALAFKEMLNKTGLNMETLAPLLKDDVEIKRILEKRKQMNVGWKTFLEKTLSGEETEELKTAKKIKSEDIAGMFLSKTDQPPAGKAGPTQSSPLQMLERLLHLFYRAAKKRRLLLIRFNGHIQNILFPGMGFASRLLNYIGNRGALVQQTQFAVGSAFGSGINKNPASLFQNLIHVRNHASGIAKRVTAFNPVFQKLRIPRFGHRCFEISRREDLSRHIHPDFFMKQDKRAGGAVIKELIHAVAGCNQERQFRAVYGHHCRNLLLPLSPQKFASAIHSHNCSDG